MSRLKLAYYGDDFTGSTDAMEALAQHGMKTVLFLHPPTPGELQRFPDLDAFGIAGVGRSLTPEEMEKELLPAFRSIRQSGVKIAHYKTCSTFDSAPHIGSIGKAIELGRTVFNEQSFVPLVVGVPQLKRYTMFGQHFAAIRGQVYRLDRHPVMSRHPVTPMNEADLCKHLSKQTTLKSDVIHIIQLSETPEEVRKVLKEKVNEGHQIILFDVLDEHTLERIAHILWQEQMQSSPFFTVGSSGIEYAFARYWQQQGLIQREHKLASNPLTGEQLVVVSGSCSQITAEQIRYAEQSGFRTLKLPVEPLVDEMKLQEWNKQVFTWAEKQLKDGRHILLYSAAGPDDESIIEMREQFRKAGLKESDTAERIGRIFGQICRHLVDTLGVRRIAVAGGDTSGYVTRELDIYALETLALVAPGGPLCRGYFERTSQDAIEIALKGGQVGDADYFVKLSEL